MKHLCGPAPAPGLCFHKVDFIAAGPKLEPQAVYRRLVAVMTVQRLAEPSDLDARIAVLLRVEIFPPAEAIDCDRIGFEQGATAGLGFCDDEPAATPPSRQTATGGRRFHSGSVLFTSFLST